MSLSDPDNIWKSSYSSLNLEYRFNKPQFINQDGNVLVYDNIFQSFVFFGAVLISNANLLIYDKDVNLEEK